MDEQQGLFPIPVGLSQSQLQRLDDLTTKAAVSSLEGLLGKVEIHAAAARQAHAVSRLVNVRLAEAIRDVHRKLAMEWEEIPEQSRRWLLGAMQYFVCSKDEEPDFDSPIGFEDDAEVLNACLRFAKRTEMCLNLEDYDDV